MDERTQTFIEAAIEREWLTRDQADECLRIQETVKEVGIDQKIEEILVKKGYLKPDQARDLSRKLSKMKVGKYQIVEKLGEGGAGIVYRANQEPLDRVVAIKVLSKRRKTSEQYLERFLREARIAVTLNHENIVKGLDYGESDGYHYFVMEYVEGDSLHDVLRKEGTLEEKRGFEIALQTAHALQHAAKYDLVHRDIKPENLMITESRVVKLCDMGLAKPSLVETAQASKDGTTIGTPTYMSPEQIRGRDDADFRSDVYSLGATLYHMVTGRPPFTGSSADVVVRKHLQEQVTDPRELNLELSAAAAAVILKMLAKRPQERYGSLDALEDDLQAVLAGRPPRHTIHVGRQTVAKAPVDLEEVSSRRERQDREKSRKLLISLAVTVCVVVLAATGLIVLNPFGGKQDRPADTGQGEPPAEVPVKPSAPNMDELGEEFFKEVEEFEREHPDSDPDSMIDRYQLVVERYPGTRWAVSAKDRIRDIEEAKQLAARRHLAEAKRSYESLSGEIEKLAAARKYGEALAKASEYPEEFSDTDYPEKLALAADRIRQDAGKKAEELLASADTQMARGSFDEAVETLTSMIGFGIPEVETRAREKLEEVRSAKVAEGRARKKGAEAFRNVVGTAYGYAAEGRYQDAEEFLVRAEGREELTYFRQDLTKAWQDLRQARRFAKALPRGAARLVGKPEKLALAKGGRKLGKVSGADDDGIRLARGQGEESVPYASLAPSDRVRIAFLSLDEDKADDHRAAVLYLIVNGFLSDADVEIEAAAILGADAEPLRARRELLAAYLRERVDSDLRKAEVKRAQKRLDEARKVIEGAVARAPWYGLAWLHLGRVLLESGKPKEALEALLRAKELETPDPHVDYWLGEALLADGRPEDALQAFQRFEERAEDDDPLLVVARGRIRELKAKVYEERIRELDSQAKIAFRAKNWDETIDLYERIFDLDPKRTDCLYYLGRAHVEKREIVMGYLGLKEYVRKDPKGRRATDARRRIQALEKTHRDNTETQEYLEQGVAEFQGGMLEDALESFDLSIEQGPLNADAYRERGATHLRTGERTGKTADFEAALRDYQTAETLDPDQKLVAEGRALCHYYLANYEDALKAAEQAIQAMPERWQSYNIAGLVELNAGRPRQALLRFADGLRWAPHVVTLYINRALCFEALERWSEALDDVKSGRKHAPTAAESKQLQDIEDRVRKAKGN